MNKTLLNLRPAGEDNYKNYPELRNSAQIMQGYKQLNDLRGIELKIKIFCKLITKYGDHNSYSINEYANTYLKYTLLDSIPGSTENYSIKLEETNYHDAKKVIGEVCSAKYSNLFIFKREFFLMVFYMSFVITSLITLFKLVNWKHYFLVALVFVTYFILTFIILELISFERYKEKDVFRAFMAIFFAVIASLSVVASKINNRQFSPVLNILNQALYLIYTYIPVTSIGILGEYTNIFHKHDYSYYELYPDDKVPPTKQQVLGNLMHEYWQDQLQRWIVYGVIFGFVTFLLLLPFFKNLFIKQLSLPKKA